MQVAEEEFVEAAESVCGGLTARQVERAVLDILTQRIRCSIRPTECLVGPRRIGQSLILGVATPIQGLQIASRVGLATPLPGMQIADWVELATPLAKDCKLING